MGTIYKPLAKTRGGRWAKKNALVRTAPVSGRKQRRGVALIMVLVLTTVLAALAADLQNAASVNLQLATNARDQLQAEFHARSAMELELFLLRFQGMIKSSLASFVPIPLFELSNFLVSSDTMKGLLTDRKDTPTDEVEKDNWASEQPFGAFQGSFWIESVVDENRKININRPPKSTCLELPQKLMAALFDDPKYDELFERLGDSKDPIRNRIEIISNITDWIDGNDSVDPVCIITGDDSRNTASEDIRYNHLPYGARYKPKNGQLSSLAELRMVPGVNDAFMELFSQYFTVWTDDAGINVNTADPLILQTLVRALMSGPPQPGDAEKFAKFMQEWQLLRILPPPMNKMSKPVFLQLLQTAGIKIDQGTFNLLEKEHIIRFDDVSNVYKITAVGRVFDAVSTITAVWRDDGRLGEIRYWREE